MAFFIMRKLIKILVITLVLLAPVIVFLFLKQYGSNQFELPVYYESGNPLKECPPGDGVHKISAELLNGQVNNFPVLLSVNNGTTNKLVFDLQNVLIKYPKVKVMPVDLDTEDPAGVLQLLNCELVLGEDRYISEVPANRFVLVDNQARIRGYFNVDELDEIGRLDMELDILLNY